MDDQANGLRRLVRQEKLPLARPRSGPKLLLVASGKGGAGTTTLALGLAAIAAQRGLHSVLVDAAEHGGDIALLCNTPEPWTVADVFSARVDAAEALQQGPGGIRILPGAWGQENLAQSAGLAQQRLLDQLHGLEPAADCIVIDGGSGSGRLLQGLWQAAHAVVAVTTPESASVMDTYASIKLLWTGEGVPRIYTLVNRASSAWIADDVHQRLARSCRRFLGISLHHAGRVADYHRWLRHGGVADPLAITTGRTGRQLRRAADVLLSSDDNTVCDAGAEWPDVPERLTA